MGRRKEERDLRSLDRRSMFSIFAPLNPSDPPAKPETGFRGRNTITGPFQPGLDDPIWKTMLTWLWLPALAGFITIEVWLQVPPVLGWLLVIGFIAAYCTLGWFAYRKR